MRGQEQVMALGIYELALLLRVGAPKQKHQPLALCSQPTDKHVRELLPALYLGARPPEPAQR